MLGTRVLKRQHADATAMVERLLDRADCYRGGHDSEVLALQLTRLIGLLRLHFVQEDCTLYAPLLDSGDPEVSRVAGDYFEEFRGLAERLDLFAYRWCSADSIGAQFGRFREELRALCEVLTRRIMLEEAYLYPLLEGRSAEARKAA